MTPQFRCTFFNDELFPAGVVVNNPLGWKNSKLVLERHPDYHSLIEYFVGDLIWVGTARQRLLDVEALAGADSQVRVLLEGRFSVANTWSQLFDGLIDCSLFEEYDKNGKPYKIKAPIIRNDFWSKFINRKSTPVDILGTFDVDGNAIAAPVVFQLPLPSQMIEYNSHYVEVGTISTTNTYSAELTIPLTEGAWVANRFLQLSFGDTIIGDAKEKFTLPLLLKTTQPVWLFEPVFDGVYRFRVQVPIIFEDFSDVDGRVTYTSSVLKIKFFAKVETSEGTTTHELTHSAEYINEVPITDNNQYQIQGTANVLVNLYSLDIETSLLKGDRFYLYGLSVSTLGPSVTEEVGVRRVTMFGGDEDAIDLTFVPKVIDYTIISDNYPCFFKVDCSTTYQATTCDSILLKDAAEGIVSKITGVANVIVSPFLDSCKGYYSLQKGLHIRGWKMAAKPMFMSFDDWWHGANPLLNLSLSNSGNTVVIGAKADQYNKVPVLNIGGIGNTVRKYDINEFVKKLEIGFDKWSAESEGGLDDVQTRKTYIVDFKTIGKDVTLLSKFFGASLGIEQTRRNSELGKDWRLDEEIMIIALKLVTGNFVPEVGTDFASITNVKNSQTRYNVRLFVARVFERWRTWFNGCMQFGLPKQFKFSKGEGNYDATSTLNPGDCDTSVNMFLDEKANISATSSFVKIPKQYNFSHGLTFSQYNTIKNNKDRAIGLSRTQESFTPHFIEKLEFLWAQGKADFEVSLADLPTQENGFRLLENDDYLLTEDNNLIELE